QIQFDFAAEEATFGVDVADGHPGDVRVCQSDKRERSRLICDDTDLDRSTGRASSFRHLLLRKKGCWMSPAQRHRSAAREHDAFALNSLHRESSPFFDHLFA